MQQGPPQNMSTPESAPKVISFEEFIRPDSDGIPRYNNFPWRFAKGFTADVYRTQEHYKRFAFEHSDMATSLCNKIQSLDESKWTPKGFQPFEKDLYEAYRIMRSYGSSNEELFA